jgi:hypothetical protein
MNQHALPSTALRPQVRVGRTVALHALFWFALCLIGATGERSDAIRFDTGNSFARLLVSWSLTHTPAFLLSTTLHLVYQRWPGVVDRPRRLVAGYLLALLFYLPCELLFVATIFRAKDGQPFALQGSWDRMMAMTRFTWFTEFAWMTGTYVGVIAVCSWRKSWQREQAWRQAQSDNLNLRLELEQQRLQALRGQLEPHFLFNALNAITALMRAGDQALAIAGVSRLSDLLRYALAASERDWVTVREELAFIRHYLALQKLRYGDRLQVLIEGDDEDVLDADCPPLLLQPLVENALRHDLDRHDGVGDLRIRFERQAGTLLIAICNPKVGQAAPNPGTGLGLRSTRARLLLACGQQASLDTTDSAARFRVEIRMPMYGSEPGLRG